MQNKNSFSAFIFSSFIYCISCTLVFAQSAALLPNSLQTYFDQNGNPLTGGTVTFYYPGTFNLKPIWKDSGEVTPWVNPITLDAAGRPPGGSGGVYGQGAYRQIVKDVNGNLQWDAVTSSAGSSSGIAATGDGDLVGTVKPWAGIAAPNQYQFAYGQQISRVTFANLFTAITQSLTVVCSSASNTLTGISDTTSINIGAPIEVAACVAPGTTVSSKTASTVVMSNPSSVNLTTIATFFPFGNGDGSTTFTLPDFRGNVIAGRPNMGGNASSNFTTSFCPNATAQGVVCGSQSKTLTQANLPNIVPTFTGASQSPNLNTQVITTNTSQQARNDANNFQAMNNANVPTTVSVTFTPGGTISSINGNVTQTAFSLIQPTLVMNYIIKVTPDTNSAIATGVTDLGGMTGSIACGTGISCTGNIITVTGSSVAAGGLNTQVQFNSSNILAGSANLTWVSPVLTIGVAGATTGNLTIAGSASSNVTQTVQASAGGSVITWGNLSGTPAVIATSPLNITSVSGTISCTTCAITTNPLSQFAATTSAQLAGVISDETGTGLAVFNTSPTLVTPTLGAALATSINGLTLTSSTGTLTIAAAKTHAVNNSITMAGIDGSTLTFQATDTYVGRATTDTLTNKTLDTAGTGNVFKINGTSITAIGGTTAKVGTVAGVLVSGHCVSIDANLNFVDAGGACTTGGGGGTVNSGTANQLAYYGGTGTVVSGNANFTVSSGALTLGIGGSVQGSLALSGVTSGTTTFAVAAAASGTLTFPAATDTIVGRATTDTLTNKTLTSPVIATIINSGTLTLPTSTDTLLGRATTDTLTNKTFDTAGTGNSFKIAGTAITSISGNTSKVVTTTGALTNNHCVSIDGSSNFIDAGAACSTVSLSAPNTWTANQTLTLTQNAGTAFIINNGSAGNTATSNFVANNNSSGVSAYGVAGTGYTQIPVLQNSAYVYGVNTTAVVVDASGTNNPIILATNDIERCRIDTVLKCKTALFGGIPHIDVTSGLQGCAVADNTNVVDATSAIQCYINYMYSTYGGGTVFFPGGNYKVVSGPIQIKGAVELLGMGDTISVLTSQFADNQVIQFDAATCAGSAIKKMWIIGYTNAATTKNAVQIGLNCRVVIRDSSIWGGFYGLYNAGVDSVIENSYICSFSPTGAGVASQGANWYIRVKLDTCGASSADAFFQATYLGPGGVTAIAENHFVESDFSGAWTRSIRIDDGGNNSAMTVINGGVFSAPILIQNARATIISDAEIGSTSFANNNPLILHGSYAFAGTTITGSGTRSCAANINITC